MIDKSTGIVINSIKYGDSSKIITAFTKDYGKLAFIAKGARNTKSKFGAALEALTISEFTFYNKVNSDLLLLSNADIIKSNVKLIKDNGKLLTGLMTAEAVNNTQEKRNINSTLYQLFEDLIYKLNDCQNEPFHLFNLFMFNLSQIMGFAINRFEILPLNADYFIDLADASISNERPISKDYYKFNYDEITYFYNLFFTENVIEYKLTKSSTQYFYDFWVRFFSFHLERKFSLKSANLL
ncbi:MAG TPA: DNA repair protein RecO [Candidatus Kapabacteria bacterium]|nr:DNA repair protein RecO [Candidatus Kapabacteria bacterium]